MTKSSYKINLGRNDGYKICCNCRKELPVSDFHKTGSVGNQGVKSICKKCKSEYAKKYYSINPDKRNKSRLELKKAFIDLYGGCCSCCGETTIEFLTIEHINRDGKYDRSVMSVHSIYKKAVENFDKSKYTVLCMNCNFAEKHGKSCPHKILKEIHEVK